MNHADTTAYKQISPVHIQSADIVWAAVSFPYILKSMSSPLLVVAAMIFRAHDFERKILIVRRGPGQSGAGFWEFPGGKIESTESPEEALKREIFEELGVDLTVLRVVGERDHQYPHRLIRLQVYEGSIACEDLQLVDHDAFEWMSLSEIQIEVLSAADRPFVALLQGLRADASK